MAFSTAKNTVSLRVAKTELEDTVFGQKKRETFLQWQYLEIYVTIHCKFRQKLEICPNIECAGLLTVIDNQQANYDLDLQEGMNISMNYEFNMLDHVGAEAKQMVALVVTVSV